jgi:hypothetical protein
MYDAVLEARQQTVPVDAVDDTPMTQEECAESSLLLRDLLCSLLQRLSDPELCVHANTNGGDAQDGNDKQLPYFAGDLTLLLAIQRKLISDFLRGFIAERGGKQPEFNPKRCNDTIQLLDGNRSALQKGNKSWGTAIVNMPMHPKTGIHEWAIQLDKCEKGHVFVGVVTADASTTTYVGGDRKGWGLIGTRALWHDRSKSRGDYGEGYCTGNTVRVRLDTNNQTLSFGCGNTDWGIGFDMLPNEPLFPAVALYQRDDQVTLLASQEASQVVADANRYRSAAVQAVQSHRTFVEYSRTLFATADEIARVADGIEDHGGRDAIVSHPIITVLTPSVASALTVSQKYSYASGYLSVQLLPPLITLTKRLGALVEHVAPEDSRDSWPLYADISGRWLIRSAQSDHIPLQEYWLCFTSETAGSPSGEPLRFIGEGVGGSPSVSVEGSVLGSRIKFLETWSLGGTCVIEGRMALDGGYFSGTYIDSKSGSSASIEGMRLSRNDNVTPASKLQRCAVVCAGACGRLLGYFVSGVECVFDSHFPIAAPRETADDDIAKERAESVSEPLDAKEIADEVPVDMDSEGAFTEDGSSPYSVTSWRTSPLFAGGLALNGRMVEGLQSFLRFYSTPEGCTDVIPFDMKAAQANLSAMDAWWYDVCFEEFAARDASSSAAAHDGEALPEAFKNVLIGAPNFDRVDSYVLGHIGQSFVMRLGGEAAKIARRTVLAALIRHSGCLPVFERECEMLQTGAKSAEARPHDVLVQVWKAAQHVVEHAIRSTNQTGLSYTVIAEMLTTKAKFLLQVQPNALCGVVEELFVLDTEFGLKPAEGNSLRTDVQDSCPKPDYSSLLSSAMDFLQTGPREIVTLEREMISCTARAMFRNAGLRSYLSLVKKGADPRMRRTEVASTGSPNLSPLSIALAITAATENILPALNGATGPTCRRNEERYLGHYLSVSMNDTCIHALLTEKAGG